jgi:hypothetical protein
MSDENKDLNEINDETKQISSSDTVEPNVEAVASQLDDKELKTDAKTTSTSSSSSSISSVSTSSSPQSSTNNTASSSSSMHQHDEFENLQKAVCILGKAKQLDEIKRYDEALKLYRQGVDMLLEELIIRQGTDQSRTYLRGKCNDFMNRIDQLKLMIQIENANNSNKENQSQITNS